MVSKFMEAFLSDFADGYAGVTHAGLTLVRLDGEPSMLLAQRAPDESDDPDVRETWEFPGGGLEEEEEPLTAAVREFEEEIGFTPEIEVVHGWRSGEDGHYQGFVAEAIFIPAASDFVPNDEVQAIGWFTVEEAGSLALRPEVAALDLAEMVSYAVSGNKEAPVEETGQDFDVEQEEPEFDPLAFAAGPIPIHGIIAPEGLESGDGRGFVGGALTSRPLRIPFRFQKSDIGGHDGAITVGSVDRIMRKDGMIHYEGLLMNSADAAELIDLIEFFDNRYGVSVDGDKAALSQQESEARGGTWFERARAAGLTAVAIPAFHEAYVSLGVHPDMPDEDDEDDGVVVAGGVSRELLSFKRGKGWVTNPKETSRLHRYWTEKGQPGYAKIGWGTPGDWRRAKALIGEKIAKNSPEKMRFLNQIISQWHFDALGYWPGELGKPGNKTHAQAKAEREAKMSAQDEATGEVRALAESREDIEMDEEGSGWEAVLVSSAHKNRPLPPVHYFDRHPDTGALVIEEPDENGFRRTYGYAGEWGVCHIGYDGQCVEVPEDPTGEYRDFHLGRTRVETADGPGYVNTGLITYKVDHRDAKRILTETAEQSHYDNIAHAWTAVRVGQDDRGVWFSGVVLPTVPEDDLVLIEASGQVSGEWKYGAMRGLQSVNIPGFAVLRSSAIHGDNGEVIALVASSTGSGCTPTPTERMGALRQVERETRFQKLRQTYQKKEK